jgi:hypothetical protein
VSPHGLWLAVGDKEFLVSFNEYPSFRDARLSELFAVELLHGVHLHWPLLDVDLHVDALELPERFPLVSRLEPRKGP